MTAASDVTAVASELRLVLSQVVRRIRSDQRVSLTQTAVLSRLERTGAMTASALAAAEWVRPQSMAHTVADLEARGLVARRPDPDDRRQLLIELTDAGLSAIADERRAVSEWLTAAIETRLAPDEQETLRAALPLLRRLLES